MKPRVQFASNVLINLSGFDLLGAPHPLIQADRRAADLGWARLILTGFGTTGPGVSDEVSNFRI